MSDDSAAHDAVNEQDEVTLSRSVDVRVSNRILARVNASAADAAGAEIMVNVRPAVVSPHVRRAHVDQEETNDAVAAAVGEAVREEADNADAYDVVAGVGIQEDQQEVVAGAAVLANQDEVDDAPAAAPAAGVQANQDNVNEICPLSLVPPFQAYISILRIMCMSIVNSCDLSTILGFHQRY